ncbi:DUF397 domain-containing protein [Streptomyces graminilatus]|uniref:DUF397 domain-containing protein n=1 Tax=Streptomyces graminilatus TaxID=1464070 RepID=UPI00099EFC10|nr:DUF397 domain-containing protein [Streptomyces graminilatus]
MRLSPDLSTARWRKSSYSGNQQGDECVEIADTYPSVVPVRDSKDTTGPVLMLNHRAWQRFVNGLKGGSL